MQTPSELLSLSNEQLGVAAYVGVLIAVYDEPSLDASLSQLAPPDDVAPIYFLQVDEHRWVGKWIHLLPLVIDNLELSVVLVHDHQLRHTARYVLDDRQNQILHSRYFSALLLTLMISSLISSLI